MVKANLACILAPENRSLQECVSVYTEVSTWDVSLTVLTPYCVSIYPNIICASLMMLILGCLPQLFFYLFRISSWTFSSLFLPDWVASKSLVSGCSPLSPRTGVMDMSHHEFLCGSWGSELMSLCLHSEHFTHSPVSQSTTKRSLCLLALDWFRNRIITVNSHNFLLFCARY